MHKRGTMAERSGPFWDAMEKREPCLARREDWSSLRCVLVPTGSGRQIRLEGSQLGRQLLANRRQRRLSPDANSNPAWLLPTPFDIDDHFSVFAAAHTQDHSSDTQIRRQCSHDVFGNLPDLRHIYIHIDAPPRRNVACTRSPSVAATMTQLCVTRCAAHVREGQDRIARRIRTLTTPSRCGRRFFQDRCGDLP